MTEKWSLTKDASMEYDYISALRTLVSGTREGIEIDKELAKEFKPLALSYEETIKMITQLLKNISTNLEKESFENILLRGELTNKICINLLEEESSDDLKKKVKRTIEELGSKKVSEEGGKLLNRVLNILEKDLDKTKRKLALIDPICAGFAY